MLAADPCPKSEQGEAEDRLVDDVEGVHAAGRRHRQGVVVPGTVGAGEGAVETRHAVHVVPDVQALRRLPAARRPEREDRVHAVAPELDGRSVRLEAAVREVPRRLRAPAAAAVARAPRRLHPRGGHPQPEAAEALPRGEEALARRRGAGRGREEERDEERKQGPAHQACSCRKGSTVSRARSGSTRKTIPLRIGNGSRVYFTESRSMISSASAPSTVPTTRPRSWALR